MALEDDEIFQTVQLAQNFNTRLNALYNGSVFDFFNRQGKELLDGTDSTDATTLQQVQALLSALETKLIAQINMANTQGLIPPGYSLQNAASLALNAGVIGTQTVLNYSGAGQLTSIIFDGTSSNIGSLGYDLKITMDGVVTTFLSAFGSGAPSVLSQNLWPYLFNTISTTSGYYPLFFYQTFKNQLLIQVSTRDTNIATGGTLRVGYAKQISS